MSIGLQPGLGTSTLVLFAYHFPFRDKLWVWVGFRVRDRTGMLIQDQQNMLIKEHVFQNHDNIT